MRSINKNRSWLKWDRVIPFSLFLITAGLISFTGCKGKARGTVSQKNTKSIKVFMLWDMEGTSGLFDKELTWYWDPGVPPEKKSEGCELLTEDVNSAARAALEAGADTVIICDTHHGGNNIFPEKLIADPRIRFLPRSVGVENGKWRWMPGLDRSVDGFMVMGHHAKAGTEEAFLSHAQSLDWADIQINGTSVGEIGIESCFAGNWDIPVIMMQGEEKGCIEASRLFPGIVTASVKHAISYEKAEGPDAASARNLTAAKVKEAIEKLRSGFQFTVYKPALPMTVSVRLKTPEAAEKLSKRFGAKLRDQYTTEEKVEKQYDVMKLFTGAGLDMPEPNKR